MPVVFSAISPHSPLLIPRIGKKNLKYLNKTLYSLRYLEQELYASKPDTLIIVTPHGYIIQDAFNINLSNQYIGQFHDFGDHATTINFQGDSMVIQMIRAGNESTYFKDDNPYVLTSISKVDWGVSVPLYYLLQHLKNLPIIPIHVSHLPLEAHYHFGEFLRKKINKINKRFALIASADLSHSRKKNKNSILSDKEIHFDKKILSNLQNKNINYFLSKDKELLKYPSICGLSSIMILLGIMQGSEYHCQLLSYEYPFGVGYSVINFIIQ